MKKRSLYFAITIAIATLLAIPGTTWAKDSKGYKGYPITLNPASLYTVLGDSLSTNQTISFTSKEALEDITLWVVPELQPYVSVEPASFPVINAGETYEFTVTSEIPEGTFPGNWNGTIHFRDGKRTKAKPLPVSLEVLYTNAVPLPTTKFLRDRTASLLDCSSSTESNLVFLGSTSELNDLQLGDVVILGITPCTPNGFIGRLSGRTNINGNVDLMLEPAGLLDAFEKLVIDINRSFTPEEVQAAMLKNEGVSLAADAVMADALAAFEFDIDKVLYDHDGNEGTTYDQVVAEGSLSIIPSLEVYADIDLSRDTIVEELSFIVGIDEDALLKLSCSAGVTAQKEYLLGQLTFQIPAGPVLISVPISLHVGVKGQLSATVSAELDQAFDMVAGIAYDGDDWEMISDFEPTYGYDLQLGAEANCTLKGYIEPGLAVLVYNVIGGRASLQAYLEMDAIATLNDFSWEFYAGMSASIGAEVSLPLGFMTLELFGVDYEVIDFKKLLASYPNGDGGEGSWQYRRYDLAGTACDPNGSTVSGGASLSHQLTIPGTDYWLLTGDVDGDGESEIITTSGSTLKIYSGNGALEKTIALPRTCELSMLEDADGDGVLDIGLGGRGPGFTGYIYKSDGTLLKSLAGLHGGSYGDHNMIPLTISNGKVLVGYNAGYSRTPRGVASFNYATGTEEWYYQIGPANGWYSLADLDGNGVLDITMNSATVHNGASGNGTTDGDLYLVVVNENGGKEISLRYPSPSNGNAWHVFQDMDGNGSMDIVAFEGHDSRYYPGQSQIHIYDQNGFITHSFNGPYSTQWQHAVGDLDNDGTKEVVASASNANKVYVLNNQLQKVDEASIVGSVKLICDVTGDGSKEIIMLTSDGWLKVLDKNLNLIDQVKCGSKSGNVITSDVNGDGIVDLLVQTDQLYVYSF